MRAWILVALTGCYDLPKPECGFACGPAGECPSSYACNAAVDRCQLVGSSPSCDRANVDAGVLDTQSDFTAPRVITQAPPPNAMDVGLAVRVHVQFDEPVMGYSDSTFRVSHLGLDEAGPVMYDPTSFTVSREFANLLPDTVYTAVLDPGITDAAGNGALVSWSFRTVDTRPPIVIMRAPVEDATNVSVGADISADFSEPVMGVNASSFTVTQNGMPLTGNLSYAEVMGARAMFNQTTQLVANTTYTVTLTSAIRDKATTPNALAPVTWSFTTGPDDQNPAVATRRPMNASTGILVNAPVVVSFNEPVLGVSTTSFTLTPQGGSPMAATVGYVAATRVATLTPAAQLAANTQYTVTLTSAITDTVNNPLSQLVWTFTTGADTIGPRVALTTPADLAVAVPTSSTVVLQFDEPVQNVSITLQGGALTGTIGLSGGLATFTPDAPLPANATVAVDVTAATDAAGNTLVAPTAFSFMTGP